MSTDKPDEIFIKWTVEDVLSVRPELSVRRACEVLASLKKNHDAETGINWDVIRTTSDDMFSFVNMDVSNLSGPALNWAVNKAAPCEGREISGKEIKRYSTNGKVGVMVDWSPATDWADAGFLIHMNKISITYRGDGVWEGRYFADDRIANICTGPTPLIAAMRAFVRGELAETISIPKEFMSED